MSITGGTFKKRNSSKALLYGGRIILIFSPVLLLLIQSFSSGRNLFMSLPVWSDELDYWREMFSFSHNGFGFGGSMFVGHDAALGPMGAHSVSPIAAWGVFFLLFRSGYAPYAILWGNIFLLTLAWFLFVKLLKPAAGPTWIAVIMAYTYPMIFLYLHSSMIEMVCMAGMILYFSILCKWDKEGDNRYFVLLIILGIWITAVRITYVVILFPVIWKKLNFRFNLKAVISMIVYVLGFLGFYKPYNLFCADYPGWVTSRINDAEGIREKLSVIFYNTRVNLITYFAPTSGDRAQVGMRYFYFVLLLFLLGAAVRNVDVKVKSKVNMLFISLAIMMGGLLVMMLTLYDIGLWRDFRTFAPLAFGVFLFLMLKENSDGLYRTFLYSFFILVSMMSFTSGVDFIKDKGITTVTDKSAYFENLELTDEEGAPRTIGVDPKINWGDITFMSSVPSKLGVQVFYGDLWEEDMKLVDYVLVTDENYEKLRELFDGCEVTVIPGYGRLVKNF